MKKKKSAAENSGGIGIECADPLIPAALREALLYFLVLNHLLKNNLLIINTESTSNYMSGALRHLHAPIITGKAFYPLYQERSYTLNIRQPYNLPANMAGDTDSGKTYKKFEKIDSANKGMERGWEKRATFSFLHRPSKSHLFDCFQDCSKLFPAPCPAEPRS